jgi:hypothetical protein
MARADIGEIVVERDRSGRPHQGKVFAAVHAHLDDVPYYAGGLCAKLIQAHLRQFPGRNCCKSLIHLAGVGGSSKT